MSMKTTIDIPDAVFRKAKARAAERGISLREFVTTALVDKLQRREAVPVRDSWPRLAKADPEETKRIQSIIDDEFSSVDRDDWQ